MKRQKRKIFFKELLHDNRKIDSKQFKTVTGSPILYTKLRKHRGIYYPLAKHHEHPKSKMRSSHKHACVVLSKTYGREVYTNIDIWPDETAKERLIQKLKGLSLSEGEEDDDDDDDVGIDMPTGINTEHEASDNGTFHTKPPDEKNEKKHVTIVLTDAEEESSSSTEQQIHPDPNQPEQQTEEEGSWPLKRSQSVNSRDNPFLPGGNLSKEADDILSKATIIRDTFILTEEQNRANKLNSQNTDKSGSNHTSANQSPVQESVTEQKIVANSECVPDEPSNSPARTRPKENGQVDGDNSLTPGSVTVELNDDSKDKKKQKKCCVIM